MQIYEDYRGSIASRIGKR